MKPFGYRRPASVEEMVATLADGARPLAGGTDLLPLMKADIQPATDLADIKHAGLPSDIHRADSGLRLGALATLADLAASELLAQQPWTMLADAARTAATRQIRNRATLGGNLLQRPRCGYFRNSDASCWLKNGDSCPAAEGVNEHHALYGSSPCRAVHPSDLAGCLLALDARVLLTGPAGEREVPLDQFFAEPTAERRLETLIETGELVTAIHVPELNEPRSGTYVKAMDRKAWQFALAGVALVASPGGDGTLSNPRIVANGVAPVPWRLKACERALAGPDGDLDAALRAVEEGALPLSGNAWKINLTRRLLRRAVEDVSALV